MKLKILSILLTLTILLVFSGCVGNYYEYSQHSQEIKDYGNGVYYFPVAGDNFGWWLSRFVKDNNAEIISISAYCQGNYGVTTGYFVIVKEKP